jgi:micrococcal nuclease
MLLVALAFIGQWISPLMRRANCRWQPSGDTLTLLLMALYVLTLLGVAALAEPVARTAIHVVDGDTIKIGDVAWRLNGFDAPETGHGKCKQEIDKGIAASFRLRALVDAAHSIEMQPQGVKTDRFGRRLGSLVLDGRDAGALLIAEGLAKPWNGRGPRPAWCPSASSSPAPRPS